MVVDGCRGIRERSGIDEVALSGGVWQNMLLLGESPLSTQEISDRLGLNPSEVSRQVKNSSRQGLVKYDTDRRRYCLA
jgi:DNA-binding MarR family transcriptional regulator